MAYIIHIRKKTAVCLVALLLISCYKVDFSGFIMRSEKANQRFDDSIEWNAANPPRKMAVDDDDYVLLTIGDPHVGTTANLDIFFGIAKEKGADAVMMVGDLTTGHKTDYKTFVNALPDQAELPSYPLVGNHDLYFGGWEHFLRLLGSSVYIVTIDTPEASDLLICIDTGSGTMGSKQTQWLRETLEKNRENYRHCMVFSHNNLFRDQRRTMSTNPPVEELHVLMELFAQHRVDLFVSGHDHQHSEAVFGNTTYLVVDALRDGLSNAGYLEIRVLGDSIDYSFNPIPSAP